MIVTFVPLCSVLGEQELLSKLKTKESTVNSNIVIFRLVFVFAAVKCIITRVNSTLCLSNLDFFLTSLLPTTSGTVSEGWRTL